MTDETNDAVVADSKAPPWNSQLWPVPGTVVQWLEQRAKAEMWPTERKNWPPEAILLREADLRIAQLNERLLEMRGRMGAEPSPAGGVEATLTIAQLEVLYAKAGKRQDNVVQMLAGEVMRLRRDVGEQATELRLLTEQLTAILPTLES